MIKPEGESQVSRLKMRRNIRRYSAPKLDRELAFASGSEAPPLSQWWLEELREERARRLRAVAANKGGRDE